MDAVERSSRVIRFHSYEADLDAGELRKNGRKVKLSGQPFQVLVILLERRGEVVSRDELQKHLWPDTFVDVDHNLNSAINKIREVLGDSAERPKFVETLPRRGYRFIADSEAAVSSAQANTVKNQGPGDEIPGGRSHLRWVIAAYAAAGFTILGLLAIAILHSRRSAPLRERQHALARITFDAGLQIGPTWSPDGRLLAYSSNRRGKFDIWVQQLSGGDPIQVTHQAGNNWQPDWSPDGNFIVYRSEDGDGGLFVMPALGGRERKISNFGYNPRWSPDGSRILFQSTQFASANRFFVLAIDGSAPQPMLTDFLTQHHASIVSPAWYPDGKRVSVLIWDKSAMPSIWTVPLAGADGIKSEIDPEVLAEMQKLYTDSFGTQDFHDFKFVWSRTGDAIYFERAVGGAKNIWKMVVERNSLRVIALERLTAGGGYDTDLALSSDGRRLAFTSETRQQRTWQFAWDGKSGRLTDRGVPITRPGFNVHGHAITLDGSKLVFVAQPRHRPQLWLKSLTDGSEEQLFEDDYQRYFPVWSPDGKRLAYARLEPRSNKEQIVIWSADSRAEEPLTSPSIRWKYTYDWSRDGKQLLVSQGAGSREPLEIWSLPTSGQGEPLARRIAGDPASDLYQPHFSPDQRWIVFEAVKESEAQSVLFVIPANGGTWIPITASPHWDDKPRWSPDGNILYFVSEAHGFFNVWGVHFDGSRGRPIGKPFQVSKFETPDLMIPTYMPPVELSVAANRMVLNLTEAAGAIWILDDVGP